MFFKKIILSSCLLTSVFSMEMADFDKPPVFHHVLAFPQKEYPVKEFKNSLKSYVGVMYEGEEPQPQGNSGLASLRESLKTYDKSTFHLDSFEYDTGKEQKLFQVFQEEKEIQKLYPSLEYAEKISFFKKTKFQTDINKHTFVEWLMLYACTGHDAYFEKIMNHPSFMAFHPEEDKRENETIARAMRAYLLNTTWSVESPTMMMPMEVPAEMMSLERYGQLIHEEPKKRCFQTAMNWYTTYFQSRWKGV